VNRGHAIRKPIPIEPPLEQIRPTKIRVVGMNAMDFAPTRSHKKYVVVEGPLNDPKLVDLIGVGLAPPLGMHRLGSWARTSADFRFAENYRVARLELPHCHLSACW
jgi:hypothetical protein